MRPKRPVNLSKRISNPHAALLKKRMAQAPTKPGIYRWMDSEGTILYVGKAKNLRNRLKSYVAPRQGDIGPWRLSFYQQIADFEVTITTSEIEALVLETNLIKTLRPKYNVLMKDGKNYLYIRIPTGDAYPQIEVQRQIQKDDAKYFGPYMSSYDVNQLLDMLNLLFHFRACKQSLDLLNRAAEKGEEISIEEKMRPCLEHQIGLCNGLCAGKLTQEQYRESINQAINFLKGDEESVKKLLTEKMQEAARERRFETAAQLRNYLHLLDRQTEEESIVSDTTGEDSDIIGVALLAGRAHVVVMVRRRGKVIGDTSFSLSGQAESISTVLEQFLPQFYGDAEEIPETVILPEEVPDQDVMEQWLSEKRGRKVKIIVPERGKKSHLLQLAEKNAHEKAIQQEAKWEADQRNTESALQELKEALHLPALPQRIEGYDISHLGGTETVGSMVVTINGKPARDHYRSFTLRGLKELEVDDYKSLKEVLTRRLKYLVSNRKKEEQEWQKAGVTLGKPRKAELLKIKEIVDTEFPTLGEIPHDDCDYLVARLGDEIIGLARFCKHKGAITELDVLWSRQQEQQKGLQKLLARKILEKIKKGKVYSVIHPMLENAYGELGFRYIHEPPKILADKVHVDDFNQDDSNRIVMMYDALQNKVDPSFTSQPHLLMIDGGKGQLSTVVEVLRSLKLDIPVIGLAKREEEVFVPGQKISIIFPKDSQAKFLLMRLRDEAHRFANRHREGRGLKKSTQSAIDEIAGLGPMTKSRLLKKFGSISGIKNASNAELLTMITEPQLEKLREYFAQK